MSANDQGARSSEASPRPFSYRQDLIDQVRRKKWFYEFLLPDGTRTESYLPPEVRAIHETRLEMASRATTAAFGPDWNNRSCLDLACHEGFFAIQFAQRGCKPVLGIDARSQHVNAAVLMKQVYGLDDRMDFRTMDVMRLSPAELGKFDVVLMLGLLYHVENPVGLLRTAFSHTRGICIVESQVAPGGYHADTIEWGGRQDVRSVVGAMFVIDESPQLLANNPEANMSPISFAPDLKALLFLMRSVGFRRVELISPLPDAYEQHVRGKRVVVVGSL